MKSAATLLLVLLFLSGSNRCASGFDGFETNNLEQLRAQLLDAYAELYDEDECAPGPCSPLPGAGTHDGPAAMGKPLPTFHTTAEAQAEYNNGVNDGFHAALQGYYFQGHGGEGAGSVAKAQIARPEGAAAVGTYTGVTHFAHVNDPRLVTFLFSGGRHQVEAESNTYLTIDVSPGGNPFLDAQERFIQESLKSASTWVSTATVRRDDGTPVHYALFSGGSGRDPTTGQSVVDPSLLYAFEENPDGTLEPPVEEWIEAVRERSPRFCNMIDLGDLHDAEGRKVSSAGTPDLIVTGTGGLDVYSAAEEGGWNRTRFISIRLLPEEYGSDTVAFLGAEKLGDFLVIGARTRSRNAGEEFDAPSLVWNYKKDEIVQQLGDKAMTVSVAVLDDERHVLLGSGSQADLSGEPNLMFDAIFGESSSGDALGSEDDGLARFNAILGGLSSEDPLGSEDNGLAGKFVSAKAGTKGATLTEEAFGVSSFSYSFADVAFHERLTSTYKSKSGKSQRPTSTYKSKNGKSRKGTDLRLKLSDTQLTPDMPRNYTYPFQRVDPTPVSSEEYFVVPASGNTRTRQVTTFSMDGVDQVLEVNSAQTCNVYNRGSPGSPAHRILPLPGSEGVILMLPDGNARPIYARGGDVLVTEDTVYFVLAIYNGNNTVYSFSKDFLN